MPHGLNIVLVEPQIPQNTGSIGRLALAVGARLHLVEPLGFEITHAKLKRAGLDYWEHLDVVVHANLDAFIEQLPPDPPLALFTKKAGNTVFDQSYREGHYLVFGHEVTGLPEEFIARFALAATRIPMYDARVRSLNLANCASIAVYEAIRQLGS